jgi:hypothetical protein
MSIQFELNIGIDNYPAAYAKIVSQSSDNNGEKTSIAYRVSVWKSAVHKEQEISTIDNDVFEVALVDLISADFAGLYTHLMMQNKYKDGVAV